MRHSISASPRQNLRLVHPLDACQRIRPMEAFERAMREGPSQVEPPRVDWYRVWSYGLALTFTAACWYVVLWVMG